MEQNTDFNPEMVVCIDDVDHQLSLFEGADYLDEEDEITPAGIGHTQVEWQRSADEEYRAWMLRGLKESAVAIRDRKLTDAIEEAVTQLGPLPSAPVVPPLNAQFLLDLFLAEPRCEEFLGDLRERYEKKRKRLDKGRADLWYYKQVATSLWPLFRAFLARSSKGSLARIFCLVLRFLGQGSWADAIRKAADEERKRSV